MTLLESQIEAVLARHYKQLISADLQFVGRQVRLGTLRVDLLFKDAQNKDVVVEVKRNSISREDIGQIIEYLGALEDGRVIIIAPYISSNIKRVFDHFGLEYREFDHNYIERLYRNLTDVPVPEQNLQPLKMRLHQPISKNGPRDGNVAFKITFVDSRWNGVCSDELYREHLAQKRRWCTEQDGNCRQKKYRDASNLGRDGVPCYDSVALKRLQFSPGFDHGELSGDKPRRILDAKQGKICVFTSQYLEDKKGDGRFIFAICQIKSIRPNSGWTGEMYICRRETAIILLESQYLNFWDYYYNRNAPEKKRWGQGLFRYLDDSMVMQMLKDIKDGANYKEGQRSKAEELMKLVS